MKEVLLKEAGIELIVTDESPPEQRRKQVVSTMTFYDHLLSQMMLLSLMKWSDYVVHSFASSIDLQ